MTGGTVAPARRRRREPVSARRRTASSPSSPSAPTPRAISCRDRGSSRGWGDPAVSGAVRPSPRQTWSGTPSARRSGVGSGTATSGCGAMASGAASRGPAAQQEPVEQPGVLLDGVDVGDETRRRFGIRLADELSDLEVAQRLHAVGLADRLRRLGVDVVGVRAAGVAEPAVPRRIGVLQPLHLGGFSGHPDPGEAAGHERVAAGGRRDQGRRGWCRCRSSRGPRPR